MKYALFCFLCAIGLDAEAQDVLSFGSQEPAAETESQLHSPIQDSPRPEPALPALLRLFDEYQVVGLSDLHGCDTQAHTYSDTPALFHLLQTIRKANLKLSEARRVRVLLIDPPVDWTEIQSKADMNRADFDRESHMAELLEREVYAKEGKALFFAGGAHLGRGRSPLQALERSHPGTTFNIGIHEGFGSRTDELEARLASWPKPAFARIRRTWWGELAPPPSGDVFFGPDGKRVQPRSDRKIQDNWDAILYLGR